MAHSMAKLPARSFRLVAALLLAGLAVSACVGTDPVEGPSTTAPTEAPPATEAPDTTEAPSTTEAPDTTEAPPATEAPTDTTGEEDDGEGVPAEVIWIGLAFIILISLLGYYIGRSRNSEAGSPDAGDSGDETP